MQISSSNMLLPPNTTLIFLEVKAGQSRTLYLRIKMLKTKVSHRKRFLWQILIIRRDHFLFKKICKTSCMLLVSWGMFILQVYNLLLRGPHLTSEIKLFLGNQSSSRSNINNIIKMSDSLTEGQVHKFWTRNILPRKNNILQLCFLGKLTKIRIIIQASPLNSHS